MTQSDNNRFDHKFAVLITIVAGTLLIGIGNCSRSVSSPRPQVAGKAYIGVESPVVVPSPYRSFDMSGEARSPKIGHRDYRNHPVEPPHPPPLPETVPVASGQFASDPIAFRNMMDIQLEAMRKCAREHGGTCPGGVTEADINRMQKEGRVPN